MMKAPTKFQTQTVEVECIVVAGPSYLVGGNRQKFGDRHRTSLQEARGLVVQGKARIVEGSEKEEWI